jgi:ADP-heptose:LPS heptosyltransferase
MKKILLVFPQGIGDFLNALDALLIKIKYNKNIKLFFYVQYKAQYTIINFFFKRFQKEIFIKEQHGIWANLIYFSKLTFKNFDIVIIDPFISAIKTKFLIFFLRSRVFFSNYCSKKKKYINYNYNNRYFTYNKISKNQLITNIFDQNKKMSNNFGGIKKEDILGLGIGSGTLEKHKRWKAEKFSELLNHFNKDRYFANWKFVIYGFFNEEYKIYQTIKSFSSQKNLYFFSSNNYMKYFTNISKLRLFISNDTGFSHLSSLINIKTIVIAGPTNPIYYKNNNFKKIIRSNINCSPCYPELRFGCGNEKCLDGIDSKNVYLQAKKILNN